MDNEGKSHVQKPSFSSVGYLQQNASQVSEAIPIYARETSQAIEEPQNAHKIVEDSASSSKSAPPSNSKDLNSIKAAITFDVKACAKPSDSKPYQIPSLSYLSTRPVNPLNKVSQMSSGIRPNGGANGYRPSANSAASSNHGHSGFFSKNNHTGSRSSYAAANNTDRFQVREKCSSNQSYEPSSELVRGPRANNGMKFSSSSAKKESLNLFVHREKYNKSDFQIKHDQAKFFMIKSSSEDDIHKSIKYNVWASTPAGNKKLDAAFRDAEMERNERGTECPIFLFFSVNASGQFVGLAEMTGRVDFKKNMDFWQQDRWNGFFPVTWHIVKDIPNRHFQNIILEYNDNRCVTYSRDTQEIRLPEGLRMLYMFKNYPLVSSILDDFDFYENREKSLHTVRRNKPALAHQKLDFSHDSSLKNLEAEFGNLSMYTMARRPHHDPKSSPDNLGRYPFHNNWHRRQHHSFSRS